MAVVVGGGRDEQALLTMGLLGGDVLVGCGEKVPEEPQPPHPPAP